MRRMLLPPASVLALLLVVLPSFALAQGAAPSADGGNGPLVTLTVRDSLLVPDEGNRVVASVSLAEPAELRLRVVDFDGRTVRELFKGNRPAGRMTEGWFGRDAAGAPVPVGPYRLVATASADGVTERSEAWITVADGAVYPRAPELITIAVDPGHGGDYDGAVAPDGTREADLNLDIGLRLARMLEGAGVNVVITRTTDGHVNEPPRDRTGDGVIDGDDELAARPDLANGARADLFLSIHNNTAVNRSVGGPSTFYYDDRPFGDRSARLALIVQQEMLEALAGSVNGSWQPYDHGALVYPYYVLRSYDPPRLRRPTQMPGVLSEGMFLSNERELRLLQRPAVRAAMATAYYRAIARYLSGRGTHVGYRLVTEPEGLVESGQTVRYAVEVRNQGTEAIRGWRLSVNAVGAPARYVGRIGRGKLVGEARIPRLEPGDTTVVEVEVTAPAEAREWMLVFDARAGNGKRAAQLGSPALQVRLTTVAPEPSPAPSAEGAA
ncbi:MAG: N-acetylmuramoyl-L-alanine amidase [Chloroflexota bacterium]